VSLVLPAPTGGELRRSYSIASPPDASSARFELAVTRVERGPGSNYLHALAAGTRLRVIGPQGFFTRPLDKAAPSLLVGTGTGVTPLRSMVRHALARGHGAPMTLLFGVRTEGDILYREELERLAATHQELRVEFSLSRAGDDWVGRRGYVQTHVRELWGDLRERGDAPPHAYVCGLQRMVGAVRELLRNEMQVPRQQVHSERYD
jgi:ferredoxin-NADP reductase